MGLLNMFSGSPGQQGLLAGSMAMLNAGGPSRMPISLGQALAQGMGAGQVGYNSAIKRQQDEQELEMQNQYREAQIQKMRDDAAARERRDGLLQSLNVGGAAPDKVEGIGMALLYDGDPRGQAVLAQAAKMKEAANKQAEFTGFKATDTPDRAGAAERFMGPELAQVPGVHQRAMALGNYVQQTPDGKGDAGYVRKELAELDKMVEGYNNKMRDENARKELAYSRELSANERASESLALRKQLADAEESRKRDAQQAKDDEKAAATASRKATLTAQTDAVLKTVQEAKALTGWTTAGAAGVLAALPYTDARKLAGHVETVKANLGFDRLQQMRDMSPTGGALGQVAVQELVSLQSTVAKLDQLQKPSDVIAALDKIEQHYTRWREALGGKAPEAKAPQAAINMLKMNPSLAEAFDAKYGAGAAAAALGK